MKKVFPFYSIGHFINQPGNPTAFEVTRFEAMEEPQVEDPHKHTFYEILWFEVGKTTQVIDYREYEVMPETLYFISPGQLHHFEDWQDMKGGGIMFTEDFFLLNRQDKNRLFELTFLDNFYSNPYIKPAPQEYARIREIIQLLEKERNRADYDPRIAQSLLHIILYQIQRCIDAERGRPVSKKCAVLYKQFKSLLDQHFAAALSAGEYAQKLFVTQHHLNFVCKEMTGRTATHIIRARSVLEAKRLLTFSDSSISEVAGQLGYFDLSYFAKVFKKETGVAPLDFRKAVSEKYRNL